VYWLVCYQSMLWLYRLVELVSLSYRVTVAYGICVMTYIYILLLYMVPVFPCCIYVSTVMPWLSGQGQTIKSIKSSQSSTKTQNWLGTVHQKNQQQSNKQENIIEEEEEEAADFFGLKKKGRTGYTSVSSYHIIISIKLC
jgi:hypothetical protein